MLRPPPQTERPSLAMRSSGEEKEAVAQQRMMEGDATEDDGVIATAFAVGGGVMSTEEETLPRCATTTVYIVPGAWRRDATPSLFACGGRLFVVLLCGDPHRERGESAAGRVVLCWVLLLSCILMSAPEKRSKWCGGYCGRRAEAMARFVHQALCACCVVVWCPAACRRGEREG